MTTTALITLPVADSWTVSVGGGWIVVLLIGMGLCFVAMFASMWLMGGAHAWPFCGWRRPLQTALTSHDQRLAERDVSLDDDHERSATLTGAALPRADQDVTSHASERSQR